MQQLLTGRIRLPGFKTRWKLHSLNAICELSTGYWGATKPERSRNKPTRIIRAGDISTDGALTSTALRYLSNEEHAGAKCTYDDVVITTSGNGLGKTWWCDGRANIAASNFVRVLRPNPDHAIGKFIYYALRSSVSIRKLREYTATSAYPNLRLSYFSSPWIQLPVLEEQSAIAPVLSDMDAEIAALEARRAKTAAIKQGMMQELLTGRIRLV